MEKNRMKILAIGAHPDDIEIFMFGFLSVCKKRGDDIGLIVATDGGAGIINMKKNLPKIREMETRRALKDLGEVKLLGLQDGKLSQSDTNSDLIRDAVFHEKPDLIITHAPEDYHPDHRALSKFVENIAGFKYPIIFADTLMGINFKVDFYVDITSCFDSKIKAIMHHKSQSPSKFASAAELLNRFRAAQCNAPENNYAEAYRFSSRFPFADIRSVLPDPPILRPFYTNNKESFI